jgi:hypothetical protein
MYRFRYNKGSRAMGSDLTGFRSRAQELRRAADGATDPFIRKLLLQLAVDFEAEAACRQMASDPGPTTDAPNGTREPVA